MDTIRDLFSANLRRLRGKRTQADIAEVAKIPFRTYQNMEAGVIPQEATLRAVAQAFGVPETTLFQDPNAATIHPAAEEMLELAVRRVLSVGGATPLAQLAALLARVPADVLAMLAQADESALCRVRQALAFDPQEFGSGSGCEDEEPKKRPAGR